MDILAKKLGAFGSPTRVGVYVVLVEGRPSVCLKREAEDVVILAMDRRGAKELAKLLRMADSLIGQGEDPDPGFRG